MLEAEKTLVLAEKGGQDDEDNEVELLVAGKKFRILATMNPGGDFGKKEVNIKANWKYDILLVILTVSWLEVQCKNTSTCSGIQCFLIGACHTALKDDWDTPVLHHFCVLSFWQYCVNTEQNVKENLQALNTVGRLGYQNISSMWNVVHEASKSSPNMKLR